MTEKPRKTVRMIDEVARDSGGLSAYCSPSVIYQAMADVLFL